LTQAPSFTKLRLSPKAGFTPAMPLGISTHSPKETIK
jgi:hypothetical protein